MPHTSLAYRILANIGSRSVVLLGPFSAKLRRGDRERRLALARWIEWAARARDPSRPLVWFHAASVGEGLQAQAVMRQVRRLKPDWQLIYSHFSPSAAPLASRQPVDRADFLPYDTVANAERLLRALHPTALVFTKLDLWPELACQAKQQGVRLGMVAGTVSPVSRRLGLARGLTRPGYAALDRVGAIAAADAERLALLGADPGRIAVTGDPRFDSAAERAAAIDPADPLHRLTAGRPTLVAGSTWPTDEDILLDAFRLVLAGRPQARLVLVPHEPTTSHLARLDRQAARVGLRTIRLSALSPGAAPDLVVVDQVGVLATLYRGAALAYVGGGYGRAGLHSVLEPAACAVPVAFGPRWQSSREAGLLVHQGGAVALPNGRSGTPLAKAWSSWLNNDAARREAGRRALHVINQGLGAAEQNAALVLDLVERGA